MRVETPARVIVVIATWVGIKISASLSRRYSRRIVNQITVAFTLVVSIVGLWKYIFWLLRYL